MAVPCTTTDLIVGTYKLCLNGIDLGPTDGAISISQDNEYNEIYTGQSTSLVSKNRTRQNFSITATMLALSLDKLRVYYGVKEGLIASPGGLAISADQGCTFPEEHTLTVIGPGPGCGARHIYFPRIIITPDQLNYEIDPTTHTKLEVMFTALPSCNGLICSMLDGATLTTVISDIADGNPDGQTTATVACQATAYPDFTTAAP
tara:strand:- start:32921 stop:33532 length:612 start_codon:yes stop_codon:yes gene_type:complete